jgi:hypothetical protein
LSSSKSKTFSKDGFSQNNVKSLYAHLSYLFMRLDLNPNKKPVLVFNDIEGVTRRTSFSLDRKLIRDPQKMNLYPFIEK